MNDKYRWHDLLANPEELPEEYNQCAIAFMQYSGTGYLLCYYKHGKWMIDDFTQLTIAKHRILAWKYFEPFGGDES